MFEFGASHKAVRCYGVRINNPWNYSIGGHSAFIGTNYDARTDDFRFAHQPGVSPNRSP